MRLLGVFDKDVTVTNASSFGSMLGSTVLDPFIMGSDARFGSLPMKLAISSGLLSSGCNVADLGFVPSPVLARIAREERVWGLHVSSDPYPPQYVGAKIYDPGGQPWDGKLQPDTVSEVGRLASIDLVPNYMGELIDIYDVEPMRVVVDSANGPTGHVVPALLRSVGMEVTEVNTSLSPMPSRGYEPSADNLRDLEFIVRRKRADLGVAFDGAGSKAGFVVPGSYISSGRAMALLMKFNGFDRAVADYGATDLLDLVGVV
jgi:phosphomannomutase